MSTNAAPGQFFAAPPMAEPVLPWRPEYGCIEDPGEVVDLGGDVYVYSSPDYAVDVNTVYAITPDGVIVLDSQLLPLHAEAVVRDIRARTNVPIRYVSNSHHHPDHVFGNTVFQNEGAELVSSYFTARLIDSSGFWYLMFLAGVWGEHLPQGYAVPRNTFVKSCELWLGKTAVQLFEFTDSTTVAGESVDVTMAWFPKTKVLHVADTVWPGAHTFFADGTSVPDWFIQLGHLRELVNELKPRIIVPGHGAPGDVGMIDAQERYLRDSCPDGRGLLPGRRGAARRRGQGQAAPGHHQRVPPAPEPHPARHQPPAAPDARAAGLPRRAARRRDRTAAAELPLTDVRDERKKGSTCT